MFPAGLGILFCSLICVVLGIPNDGGENFNQICSENIRVIQRELDILRQELKYQGEEIKRLKQEAYPNSGHTRNSMKAERSSVITDHTHDEVFQTDSTSLSHDVNSHHEKIFRQGRILMPFNSSSQGVKSLVIFYPLLYFCALPARSMPANALKGF